MCMYGGPEAVVSRSSLAHGGKRRDSAGLTDNCLDHGAGTHHTSFWCKINFFGI